MALILHCGAKEIEYDDLRHVAIPPATQSHVPLAHFRLVETIRYALGFHGHEIIDEKHGITEDGMRYFGALMLKSPYGNYIDSVGLRNSNDKTFPIGVAFGAKVMVCDNLSFHSTHVIRRKHTTNSLRDLPGLVSELVEPLRAEREAQHVCFERYQATPLTDERADHAILSMFRRRIIGLQRIGDVVSEWDNPSHDWGDRTAWRLFNAATFALAGRVSENPGITRELHQVIDGFCEEV